MFPFPPIFGAAAKAGPNGGSKKAVALGDVAAAGEGGQWEIVYSSILKSACARLQLHVHRCACVSLPCPRMIGQHIT